MTVPIACPGCGQPLDQASATAGPLAALSGADEEWARRLRDERLTAVPG